MFLTRLAAADFRNLASVAIAPAPGLNLLHGENGQGKTNTLEAICLLSRGRSYRAGASEREFIREGQGAARISCELSRAGRRHTLSLRFTHGGRKVFEIDGYGAVRASEFYAKLSVVAFFPSHLSLVREGPHARRAFLDTAISQTDRAYLRTLQDYRHALLQRNRLLLIANKEGRAPDPAEILPWSRALASLCMKITQARGEYLAQLEEAASDILLRMSGGRETLSLRYRGHPDEARNLSLLTEHLPRECALGSTGFGAHREDFSILLSRGEGSARKEEDAHPRPARAFASEGQGKSIAVALKLAEAKIAESMLGEPPVILLDDVLPELDPARRAFLLSSLGGSPARAGEPARQIFLTTCEQELPAAAPAAERRYLVREGELLEEK